MNYGNHYGGGRPRGHLQATPQPPVYNHPRNFPRPYLGQQAQHPLPHPRRRMPPAFPVEIWEKVVVFLPRRHQITCLYVCRMFYAVALRFLLSTISIHLEENTCYFDNGGQWNERWREREGTAVNTVVQCNRLLWRISREPNLAKSVRTMVLFMEDQTDTRHLAYMEPALRALPHLQGFRLVVTRWKNTDVPADQGSVKWLLQALLRHCRGLREVLLPHSLAWFASQCLAHQPSLRKFVCRSRLGLDMQIPDQDAHQFVEEASKVQASLPANMYLGQHLISLSIEWLIFDIIPVKVLPQLVELELYNHDNCRRMFKNISSNCRSLQSLTIHEFYGYSDRRMPVPGVQLKPNEYDMPFAVIPSPCPTNTLTLLTPQTGRNAPHDPLRRLTSFKWVAYQDVLSESVCKDLTKFLGGRSNLRRVDIKAVILNKDLAKAVLHALNQMPHLEVLGFEFRDRRKALESGLDLLSRIPQTVTHLKYHVVGWNLKARFNTPDEVVKRALAKLPRLKFLYLYDGILHENREDYIRLATPYPHFDWKSLKFLGLECHWIDIDRDSRGRALISQWPPRLAMWSPYEAAERLGEDGEWLLRYNRDMEDLNTDSF